VIAAIFPGQGAQAVGMGADLAAAHAVARRTFDEADDVLGYPLSEVCFTGPIERLTQTDVCQPALVAASVAAFRTAQEVAGLEPDIVFGHSLGEYSALVACGAMQLEQALRIVAERGAAMRAAAQASPGAMLAVLGLEADEVTRLMEGVAGTWPANDNCPGQMVVSGTLAGIDALEAAATERGVRTARLLVDGAFHSPLMEPAAERLRPALQGWDPATPEIDFLSTTTCALEPPRRLREVLLDQLTSPVRFGPAVTTACNMGVERVIECGPGRVLSGLVRRVSRDVAVSQVGVPSDLDALVAR
jgi:[acyl-carrier-protein] S-malonyltransferase